MARFFLTFCLVATFMPVFCENNKPAFVGIWAEHWAADEDGASVTDIDTIRVSMSAQNQIQISCINKADNFIYTDIVLSGDTLTFTMQSVFEWNKEPFYVYYTLILDKNGENANGEIINSDINTNLIFWERLKPN
ncbi:MAG: hypothetical protein ACK5MK_10270 [Dysgonomonas sp.]